MAKEAVAVKESAAKDSPAGKAYRVLIADDHPVVRRGLRQILEAQPGIEVCGEVSNGKEAIERVKQDKPNLIVLDLTMPELDGLEATHKLREECPETDILIMTMHFAEELARDLIRSGARGYILKTDADVELIAAIHRIRERGTFFTSQLADTMTECFVRDPVEVGPIAGAPLTPREVQIVELLARGKSNKEVASQLGVSTRTIESHRTHIMRKMKFGSLSELVRFAIRNSLIDL
ncbi:MAG: response regulator transcription factor [Candidatus Acidiferrales bacterium]